MKRRMRTLWMAVIVSAWAAFAGCSDEGDPVAPGGGAPPDSVSYAKDIQPIFDARCVDCHGAGGSGGLDLRSPQSRGNLVDILSPTYSAPRVEPGDPAASVLFDKVSGGGTFGDRMPLGQTPLTPDQVETIRRWIEHGAPAN